jgi:hypothetical protein
MSGVGRLEKLFEMIDGLPRLELEVALGSGNELLVRIVSLLVVVTPVATGNDCDALGSPLWPPLVAFGAPLCALAGCLEWRPSTATRGCLPITLDENGPNRLLTRGVLGGDVEQLLRSLWLIAAELIHQGSTARAGPEC